MKIKSCGLGILPASSLMDSAESLHLMTENYPPFNMRVSGENTGGLDDPVTGISTETAKADSSMQERMKNWRVQRDGHIGKMTKTI